MTTASGVAATRPPAAEPAPGRDGTDPRLFWVRPGLEPRAGRLQIAGRDAEHVARRVGTPVFAFDLAAIVERARALQAALAGAGLRYRVRFAMKAHREPEVLGAIRGLGKPGTPESVGIDACSPAEVRAAIAAGFRPAEISHTGTNLSDRDLRELLLHPSVRLNADLVTQVERLGRLAPGRAIGLRLNPRAGAFSTRTRHEAQYAAERPTKFGVYAEQLPDAVAAAARHRLTITTAHVHITRWLLNDGLDEFQRAMRVVAGMVGELVELGCPIDEVNVGGGLGVADEPGAVPLDLDAYAAVLGRTLGQLDVTVACEPGEFLTDEAGILLAEVVTVERRLGATFAGLDTGWNVMNAAFVYGTPIELVLCRAADAPRTERVTFTGNINEADDVFRSDYPFPEVIEGDVVAMLCVGGYNQAMASRHCLREPAGAVYFADRAAG